MPPTIGSHVSHYQLVRKLGAGGMGEVFLAQDDTLNRRVAIKFLLGPTSEQARKRLLAEARAVAALDHPNICAVHEIGTDAELGDYIVMQYVEGEPLDARLQRGRLPAADALALGVRIADALRTAHARGIVHRDLKPQNVVLTESGEPKLLDFGLAARVVTAPEAAEAATATRLTAPHAVVGTPGYMSPEQVRGHQSDVRSDLFALGCLLYECLTGRRAFAGATSADISAAVLHHDPVPPSTIARDLDAAHDALISRLLQKEPGDRFQSAGDALGAIRMLEPSRRSASGSAAALPAPRSNRRSTIVIGLAAAAIVTAVVLWQGPWFRRLPPPPPDAAHWYDIGVRALREGTYGTARAAFTEAVHKFDGYALAHLRLAEALAELDDALGANAALVKSAAVTPPSVRLTKEEQYRLEAVRASVSRDHNAAIAAYRALAAMFPNDASAWIDVGRAEEAAGQRVAARTSYSKAISLDGESALAHLRLGWVHVQMVAATQGLKELDEAIRLYRTAGHAEGETEALLKKGQALTTSGKNAEAHEAVNRALVLAGERNPFHRVRARFDLTRLTAVDGKYAEAEAMGNQTVTDAIDAGLYSIAASGLVDVAYTLMLKREFERADAQLTRALELATRYQATRARMRAQLQRANLRFEQDKPEESIALAQEPLRFFAEHHFVRVEADGKAILGRAYEAVENYAEASRLSTEAIALAKSMQDEALEAVVMENIAGQLASQGRLPEAHGYRERIEKINRAQNMHSSLAYDLTNRAELLIRMGRGGDAEMLLAEIEQRVQEGIEAYAARLRRVSMLRTMRASTERRWKDVESLAARALKMPDPAAPQDSTSRWATLLIHHARAQSGTARTPAAEILSILGKESVPVTRREMTYWVAQALVAQGDGKGAGALAFSVLTEPPAAENVELRWRLGAVAGLAEPLTPAGADSARIRADAIREIQALTAAWDSHAAAYVARPDLAILRQRLR